MWGRKDVTTKRANMSILNYSKGVFLMNDKTQLLTEYDLKMVNNILREMRLVAVVVQEVGECGEVYEVFWLGGEWRVVSGLYG